jgi:hypothetical protein
MKKEKERENLKQGNMSVLLLCKHINKGTGRKLRDRPRTECDCGEHGPH